MYFAISEDGYSFTDVNNGKPVIAGDSIAFQKGIRDPHITRGKDGTSLLTPPIWQPAGSPEVQKGTLWDYFGLPTGVIPPVEACPLDFPRRAYNFIWNE